VASADPAFRLGDDGTVSWRESAVARLVKGDSLYAPRPELVFSDLLSTDQLQRMNDRLAGFVTAHVATSLGRLLALESPDPAAMPTKLPAVAAPANDSPAGEPVSDDSPVAGEADDNSQAVAAPVALGGAAKGIAFILFERLGAVPTAEVAHLTRSLAESDRPLLARLGLRFGVETIYMPEMLKPAQIALRSLLYALSHGAFYDGAPPPAGRVAVDAIADVPDDYWLAVGYRRLGAKVMRVDMVERVAMLVRTAARAGQFRISDDMLSLAGATREQMGQMLLDLGCVVVGGDPVEDPEKPAVQIFERKRRQKPAPRGGKSGGPQKGKAESRPGMADKAAAGQRTNAKEANAKGANAKGTNGKAGRPGAPRRGPADKQPDPHSPFAVLAALKAKQ
jgi:ATP-dependent RNA helicase SUPV3L1/SUV3